MTLSQPHFDRAHALRRQAAEATRLLGLENRIRENVL